MSSGWNLRQTYLQLPPELYTIVQPEPVPEPKIVILNHELAAQLGLDPEKLNTTEGAEILTGNKPPPGSTPIAQAYSGHQFGHFTMLGDGRAILLGEQTAADGTVRDIQLKGSGRTPYSRRGDGRAALGPMLREHLIGEAMHALGIPTTRALAVCTTGLTTWRQEPLTGAVLCRVAASHIRVGTFQYCAALQNKNALAALTHYCLARHYPREHHEKISDSQAAQALLQSVIASQAALIAQWMCVGFIHCVINTDNMAISGETIDYGPCAFMDAHHNATVFSSIDTGGRYAYGNQPQIAFWNLARFAETLLPLIHNDPDTAIATAKEHLGKYSQLFEKNWTDLMRKKLGLFHHDPQDKQLALTLLEWMQHRAADHTNTFRLLDPEQPPTQPPWAGDDAFLHWRDQWLQRLKHQPQSPSEVRQLMHANNPDLIPRNHKVEEALAAATSGDMLPYKKLLAALKNPYQRDPSHTPYHDPAPPSDQPYVTFCGT